MDRQEIEYWRAKNRAIARRAAESLEKHLAEMNVANAVKARNDLLEFTPDLVSHFSDASAAASADWFEDVRANSNAKGTARAVMAKGPSSDHVAASVRYSAKHLWTSEPEQTLASLAASVDRYVSSAGRDTIMASVSADRARPRFARVPSSAKPCAFCLSMASRGAVYRSRETAGDFEDYHNDCGCTPTPVWSGDSLPSGYDPDDMYEQYSLARDATGQKYPTLKGRSTDPDSMSILQNLRRQQDIK